MIFLSVLLVSILAIWLLVPSYERGRRSRCQDSPTVPTMCEPDLPTLDHEHDHEDPPPPPSLPPLSVKVFDNVAVRTSAELATVAL
jgi:hypothetical protein